jgi:putative serine protease PepD
MPKFSPVPAQRLAAAVCILAATGGIAACGTTTKTQTVTVGSKTAQVSAQAGGNELDSSLVSVVEQVSPRVVQISTGSGLGSGVVYDDRGNIVTNAHVVGSAKKVTVTLPDGDRHPARTVGTFPPDDLAVVRLEPLPSPAPKAAAWADSSKLKVGQLVLAIGNPLGLRSSVTDGIISSLGRTVPEGNGAVIASAIQTSASINPGNSGGALVDLTSSVVGIPTLAATDPQLGGGQAPGIGFAIPANTIKRIAQQLIDTGHVTNSGRAYLGVSVATSVNGQGAVVASVAKGGPAADAGLHAGDIITSVDGHPTPSADELSTVLAELAPGKTVTVEVKHPDGKKDSVQLKLGQFPGTA